MRKQIVSPNPSISVHLAHDRSEIIVDDESHRSFPATAKDFGNGVAAETTPYTWSAILTVYSLEDSRRRLGALFFAGSGCRRPLDWTVPHPHSRYLRPRRLR